MLRLAALLGDQLLSGVCLLLVLPALVHLVHSFRSRRKANVEMEHLYHYVAGLSAMCCGVCFLALHIGANFATITRPEDCLWDWTSPYFWLLSRLFVQFFFVARIKQTFRGSAFALRKRKRQTIIALLLALYIPYTLCGTALMVYSVEHSMSDRRSDAMNGRRHCDYFSEKVLTKPSVFYSTIAFLVLDCILASGQLRLYIRRLYGLVDGSTDFCDDMPSAKRHQMANSGSVVSVGSFGARAPPPIRVPTLKASTSSPMHASVKKTDKKSGFTPTHTPTPIASPTPVVTPSVSSYVTTPVPKTIPDIKPQLTPLGASKTLAGFGGANGIDDERMQNVHSMVELGVFPAPCHIPQTSFEYCGGSHMPQTSFESCGHSPQTSLESAGNSPIGHTTSLTPVGGGSFFPNTKNLMPPKSALGTGSLSPRRARKRMSLSFSVSAQSLSALAANAEARRKRRKRYNPEMKRLAARTTVLALIAIMSSLAVPSLFYLFGTLVFAVDIAINSLCIYFCFSASQPMFKMCCTSCFKCSLALCIPCFFECCAWQCCECSMCDFEFLED